MIRKNNKIMRIGWLVPTVGTFGAVREMIEISNEFCRKGHQVTIYHPDGTEVKWLPSLAFTKKLSFLQTDHLDVLIGIIDWQPELYTYLTNANARVKAVCLMGFHPSEAMASALRGETDPSDNAEKMIRDAIQNKYLILADSSWQTEWIKSQVGYPAGPSFGGINLNMFSPKKENKKKDIFRFIYSGDPRSRKGTDTVEEAIEIIKSEGYVDVEFDFYWGKKFTQPQLINFIQQGDVFLDAHRRAGWCNPVIEAMACGTPSVCTNIGANRDFAIDGETALVVPVDEPEAMANAAIRLMIDDTLRENLIKNGLEKVKLFSYPLIAETLSNFLERFVYVRV